MTDELFPRTKGPRGPNRGKTALLVGLLSLAGCDFAAGGGTNSPEPPPKPEYERAFDEFADVPNQITAQVEWAAEPIDDAIHLADEIAALRTKLNIDAETFAGMCTVALKDGTIEVGAVAEIQDAKAEVEATLAKIKQVGVDLQGLPGRVKTASSGISKLVMATPKLALKSGKELTSNLSIAVGDSKVQIEADIQTVKQLPAEVKTQAKAAKDVLTELPSKAQAATQNLMAAMRGEPYTPLETTASAEGEAGAEPGAGTEPDSGSGTMVADGGQPSDGPPPPVSDPDKPIADAAPAAPPAVIATRVKQLETAAVAMTKYGDWQSAAEAYEEAFTLAPTNTLLEFKIGDSLTRAKNCTRAQLYFERFVKDADPNQYPNQIQAAKKAVGELKTFDCPIRTEEDEAAVAKTLVARAQALGAEGDWSGAALQYFRAFQKAPADPTLAYEIAAASWKAHECGDAVDYFEHFVSIADPRKYRRQITESNKYVGRAENGECKPWTKVERDTHARDLYDQGQDRELSLDYMAAAGKYERAYALVNDNHALAFRAGEAYWNAQRCSEAEGHYRAFVSNTDDMRLVDDLGKAERILARIEAHGCPNALWNSDVSKPSAPSGSGSPPPAPGANEAPPATAESGGGSAHCSVVADGAPAGGLAFGLLMLAGLLGRRRRGC